MSLAGRYDKDGSVVVEKYEGNKSEDRWKESDCILCALPVVSFHIICLSSPTGRAKWSILIEAASLFNQF